MNHARNFIFCRAVGRVTTRNFSILIAMNNYHMLNLALFYFFRPKCMPDRQKLDIPSPVGFTDHRTFPSAVSSIYCMVDVVIPCVSPKIRV